MSCTLTVIVTFFDESKSQIQSLTEHLSHLDPDKTEIIIVLDNPNECPNAFQKAVSKGLSDFIFLINKENIGVAASRNRALFAAKGKWVAFVDGDDDIDTQTQNLNANWGMKDSDVIIYDYLINREGCKPYPVDLNNESWCGQGLLSPRAIVDHFLHHCSGRSFFPFVWSKLYRREFLLKNSIFFDERLNIYEDIDFLLRLLKTAPRIRYDAGHRFYTKRELSPDKVSARRIIDGGHIFAKVLTEGSSDWQPPISDKAVNAACGLFFLKRVKNLIDQAEVLSGDQIERFVAQGIGEPSIKNGICLNTIRSPILRKKIAKFLNGNA